MTYSEVHTLVIEGADEGSWFVVHPDTCEKEKGDSEFGPWEHYACAVQHEIDHVGLEALENDGRLSPGEYKIRAWHDYDPYSHEYDGGLELVEGDNA